MRRMREWEEHRSNMAPHSFDGSLLSKNIRKRGRKRPSTSLSVCETQGAEDCDVEIMSSVSIDSNDFSCSNPAKRRRALSLGRIDLLTEEADLNSFQQESERSSSPLLHDCSVSAYSSDEDDFELGELSQSQFSFSLPENATITPPLSFTFSNSANSSLMSLPLPPPHGGVSPLRNTAQGLNQSTPKMASYIPCVGASRSERAIAALSLALANGAGGLNDYGAIISAQGDIIEEERQAGELWA